MNFVSHAIRAVRMDIPDEILSMAFKEKYTFLHGYTNRSIDSFIENNLLKDMFLLDVSPYLSPTVPITLKGSWIETSADYRTVIRIPLEVTNGRKIVAAMEMFQGPSDLPIASSFNLYTAPYGVANNLNNNSQILSASQQILNTQMGQVAIGTNALEILDINTILYRGVSRIMAQTSITVKLMLDPEMRGITIQYHNLIADVFVQFVKAKIWQSLAVRLDKAAIEGGHSIGMVSDIIGDYKDANKNYREMLSTLIVKLGTLANPKGKRDFHRQWIGAN